MRHIQQLEQLPNVGRLHAHPLSAATAATAAAAALSAGIPCGIPCGIRRCQPYPRWVPGARARGSVVVSAVITPLSRQWLRLQLVLLSRGRPLRQPHNRHVHGWHVASCRESRLVLGCIAFCATSAAVAAALFDNGIRSELYGRLRIRLCGSVGDCCGGCCSVCMHVSRYRSHRLDRRRIRQAVACQVTRSSSILSAWQGGSVERRHAASVDVSFVKQALK